MGLIWGPPGTGKTTTVSVMLHMLLMKEQRILACAPTNMAVLQVASRLIELIQDFSSSYCYSFGDIVLFGNKDRLHIGKELSKVYLDDRVHKLLRYFKREDGWKARVDSVMKFLMNCISRYQMSLDIQQASSDGCNLTFKKYFTSKFSTLVKELATCIDTFFDHLPTDSLGRNLDRMMFAKSLLDKLQQLLCADDVSDELLFTIFKPSDEPIDSFDSHDQTDDATVDLHDHDISLDDPLEIKSLCIKTLMDLSKMRLPCEDNESSIRDLCLKRAKLVFCTASSSFELFRLQNVMPISILVIDEAAQLKECEALVPLLLPGIEHILLIGDENQLSSLVKSKVCHWYGIIYMDMFSFIMSILLPIIILTSIALLILSPYCYSRLLKMLTLAEVSMRDCVQWVIESICWKYNIGCTLASTNFQMPTFMITEFLMVPVSNRKTI